MQIIEGKYTDAVIFTEVIEPTALAQIKQLCDLPSSAGAKLRIMPDVHSGIGCVIGTTMTIRDCVIPNLVGVDIGCGIEVVKLKNKFIEPEKLDKTIHALIPAGFSVRKAPHERAAEAGLSELYCADKLNMPRSLCALGTLGGGNHFIEADKNERGEIYLCIHTGSRNAGLKVAEYYQSVAVRQVRETGDTETPNALCALRGASLENYLHDMRIMQRYAAINREIIADTLCAELKYKIIERFCTVHNYIDADERILRKGAVSAKAGEKLIIPINMRDGSLIARGCGNPDWNYSAPHGAGRLYSRRAAKESFTVSEFKKSMAGIYTSSINADTLDECPMAYKDITAITDNITPTAAVIERILPIYSFKAKE